MDSQPSSETPTSSPPPPGQTFSPQPQPSTTPTDAPPVAETLPDAVPPTANATPAQPQPPAVQPPSGPEAPTPAAQQPPVPPIAPKKRRRIPKAVLITAGVVVLVLGAAAAVYFGYYQNPSVILKQGLSNTGKGYDSLADYVNDQSQAGYKGTSGSGTFTYKSGDTSTDGTVSYETDGTSSETKFDIGLAASRINADIQTLPAKTNSKNPDIYFKVSGLKGLGSAESPELNTMLNQVDNQWIVVDHTLLDNIQNAAGAGPTAPSSPSREQVMDEVKAFGKVNQEYVFTTDQSKSVTTVVKKYGKETVDGHKTYHYKMGFNRANVKQYIAAQQTALNNSKLAGWIKQNDYTKQVNAAFTDLKKSADDISGNDTFDLWVDTDKRVVYKVRVNDQTNPASNYVDIGLNYAGGDKYPFFVSYHGDQDDVKSTISLVATLDTEANTVKFNYDLSENDTFAKFQLSGDFNLKPSKQKLNLTAPKNAKQVSEVLDELGLGGLLDYYTQPASGSSSSDTSLQTFQQTLLRLQ